MQKKTKRVNRANSMWRKKGGIVGLGERVEDRREMRESIGYREDRNKIFSRTF